MKRLREILVFSKLHESGLFYTNTECTKIIVSNKPSGVIGYSCYSNIDKLEMKAEKSIITIKPNEILEVVTTNNERRFFKCTSVGYKGMEQKLVEIKC